MPAQNRSSRKRGITILAYYPIVIVLMALSVGLVLLLFPKEGKAYKDVFESAQQSEAPAPTTEVAAAEPEPTPMPEPSGFTAIEVVDSEAEIQADSGEALRRLPYKSADAWGYKNEFGKIIIKPIFEIALDFSEGRAFVGGKLETGEIAYILINEMGEQLGEDVYQDVQAFSERVAAVQKDGSWGFINLDGSALTEFAYEDAGPMKEGRAIVKQDGLYGFIDSTGTLVGDIEYLDAKNYNDGAAFVTKDDERVYAIDQAGDRIVRLARDKTGEMFASGLAFVLKEGDVTCLDKEGETMDAGPWEDAGAFTGDIAPVKSNGKWGYVDMEMNTVVQLEYQDARNLSLEGYAALQDTNGKWGYINSQGQIIIDCFYDEAEDFMDGYARVRVGSEWGIIDVTGNYRMLYVDSEARTSPEPEQTEDPEQTENPEQTEEPQE